MSHRDSHRLISQRFSAVLPKDAVGIPVMLLMDQLQIVLAPPAATTLRRSDSTGGVRKWRIPKMDGLQWKNRIYQWMIWGYPYFRKPPNVVLHSFVLVKSLLFIGGFD